MHQAIDRLRDSLIVLAFVTATVALIVAVGPIDNYDVISVSQAEVR